MHIIIVKKAAEAYKYIHINPYIKRLVAGSMCEKKTTPSQKLTTQTLNNV